jgi:DNA-binding NarL/FixJ family response regulator
MSNAGPTTKNTPTVEPVAGSTSGSQAPHCALGQGDTFAPQQLSPQQMRVLYHLRNALTNKEIARELNVADSTVKAYITQLFKMTGCRNRTELALLSSRLLPGETNSDDGEPTGPGLTSTALLRKP